jgi:hypothetical protein
MTYRHYSQGVRVYNSGFGADNATPPPPQGFTTDPNAYISPAGANNAAVEPAQMGPAQPMPSPTDLIPMAPPDASKPDTSFMPAPTPIAPIAPMAQQGFFDSFKTKLTQPGGPFGIAWRWWLLGGAAVLVYRSQSGKSGGESVTPNSRRKRSRR